MTEFELALIKALNGIAASLESVSTSLDNVPTIDREIDEAGSAVERGLVEVATAIGNLEVNR